MKKNGKKGNGKPEVTEPTEAARLQREARAEIDRMLEAEDAPELGDLLRELIWAYGKTQKEVAVASGMAPESLSRVKNDRNEYPLSRKTIGKIATGLGCTKAEADLIHRAAGYVPEDISTAFSQSGRMARLLRSVVDMSERRQRTLLKEIGG